VLDLQALRTAMPAPRVKVTSPESATGSPAPA